MRLTSARAQALENLAGVGEGQARSRSFATPMEPSMTPPPPGWRKLDHVASVEDLRRLCRRRLPREIFDFIDGAAFRERTLAANIDDFSRLRFRQRVLTDVAGRNGRTRLLGQPSELPLAIAPTGMSGALSGDGRGELHMARAARRAGVPYTLGMLSLATIEEVADEVGAPWFQICLLRERQVNVGLIERAKAAGCPVLMLTATWPLPSRMTRRIRREGAAPLRRALASFAGFAARPGWSLRALRRRNFDLRNMAPHLSGPAQGATVVALLDPTVTWTDVAWVRDRWPGKLIVKGITDPSEAAQALALGVDAVSVSNHGGNQLDEARSTLSCLPDVVAAAGDRMEVLLDGGVRSGQDVLKALALGANGCLVGRAPLYGLGAAREAGVFKALEIIRGELDVSMGLTGLRSPAEASPQIVAAAEWTPPLQSAAISSTRLPSGSWK
jgi:L-lactate dehydrogenase (cytochrome)